MVSVFTKPDVNTWEVGRTLDKLENNYASCRGFLRLSRVLPTSRVFTSGYVNTETILHFFNMSQVFEGNSLSELKPPLVADGIRIIPEICPRRQVCLRFELLGCQIESGKLLTST